MFFFFFFLLVDAQTRNNFSLCKKPALYDFKEKLYRSMYICAETRNAIAPYQVRQSIDYNTRQNAAGCYQGIEKDAAECRSVGRTENRPTGIS